MNDPRGGTQYPQFGSIPPNRRYPQLQAQMPAFGIPQGAQPPGVPLSPDMQIAMQQAAMQQMAAQTSQQIAARHAAAKQQAAVQQHMAQQQRMAQQVATQRAAAQQAAAQQAAVQQAAAQQAAAQQAAAQQAAMQRAAQQQGLSGAVPGTAIHRAAQQRMAHVAPAPVQTSNPGAPIQTVPVMSPEQQRDAAINNILASLPPQPPAGKMIPGIMTPTGRAYPITAFAMCRFSPEGLVDEIKNSFGGIIPGLNFDGRHVYIDFGENYLNEEGYENRPILLDTIVNEHRASKYLKSNPDIISLFPKPMGIVYSKDARSVLYQCHFDINNHGIYEEIQSAGLKILDVERIDRPMPAIVISLCFDATPEDVFLLDEIMVRHDSKVWSDGVVPGGEYNG